MPHPVNFPKTYFVKTIQAYKYVLSSDTSMDSSNISVNSTFMPLTSTIVLPSSNMSVPIFPDHHQPLPTIVITICLFFVFGGCVTILATCRCSKKCRVFNGESDFSEQTSSTEPQLKLWKRLGSGRYPFSAASSFRRPPQPSVMSRSKLSLRLERDRNDLQTQLTLPCLLQYATEI